MKKYVSTRKLLVFLTLVAFGFATKFIFDQVYRTTKVVIDEAFHLPQGLQYCNFNFSTWDPKITTLPGLYLVSTALFGIFRSCTVYNLRLTNWIASIINLILFYIYIGLRDGRIHTYKKALASLNLSLLPPLYFFSNLYYTDVLSLTFILLILICNYKQHHFLTCVCGLFSIIVRQTNIIWVLMVFGKYAVNEFLTVTVGVKTKYGIKDWQFLLTHPRKFSQIKKIPYNVWLDFSFYAIVFFAFGTFIYLNNGIVVGDKTAHIATLHVPQLMYFSLFYLFFSWQSCILETLPLLRLIKGKKFLLTLGFIFMIVSVHYNTEIHPYLVADNRHYTFYVWSRFYGKYPWFRYVIIPVYLYSICVIFRKLFKKNDLNFILLYTSSVALTLVPQRLIEIRYFLIPYVILKLELEKESYTVLLTELIYYLIINVFVLKIFFTKDIYWDDFDYAQKLIW